ncbi:MAG: TRAP transporter large permease subunit [Xanthomonadales bacterium]|nr:TRAP transporter large permease subunit [Xanthomonadales bacterium]
MGAWLALALFAAVCAALMLGFPVAFTLAGVSLLFAAVGALAGVFDPAFLEAVPNRIYGIMTNETLIAVPLFVFMGVTLERSRLAENLLESMAVVFSRLSGGLGVSVLLVGMLMAASTGIVGATVVTMGLMSLPTMLRNQYDPRIACGTICAAGTLGQIIPPSIVLVLLGDVISNAYQQAQRDLGIFSPDTVSVGDLFAGAIVPGLILVLGYVIYILGVAMLQPERVPRRVDHDEHVSVSRLLLAMLPPLLLIVLVLGSILGGIATPTEAAGVGAVGALVLALVQGQFSYEKLLDTMRSTVQVSSMVFLILIGAAVFSLVFRGFGGDEAVHELLNNLPGGTVGALVAVMLLMFLLGFVLDFIEITFVVVPIIGPVLLAMGIDPIWLGILIALNLQTSFLTPPFGFALFYLRGVAKDSVATRDIYRGVIPFIVVQLMVLLLVALVPGLVTWLPGVIYR